MDSGDELDIGIADYGVSKDNRSVSGSFGDTRFSCNVEWKGSFLDVTIFVVFELDGVTGLDDQSRKGFGISRFQGQEHLFFFFHHYKLVNS